MVRSFVIEYLYLVRCRFMMTNPKQGAAIMGCKALENLSQEYFGYHLVLYFCFRNWPNFRRLSILTLNVARSRDKYTVTRKHFFSFHALGWGRGTWGNLCWVCAAGLSEPLHYYSHSLWPIIDPILVTFG